MPPLDVISIARRGMRFSASRIGMSQASNSSGGESAIEEIGNHIPPSAEMVF